jgi:hypothetical protein
MSGGIYLGGRLNGTANILIKVVALSGASCPDHFDPFTGVGGNFCWATIGTGRPRIEDIDVLEGSQADEFSADGKALLVLEEKKTVLAYHSFVDNPGNTIIDEIGSGKRDFNLSKNEQIQNSMLMEYVSPADDSSEFFVVVATDHGNLIAVTPDGSSSGVAPFSAADLSVASPSCPAGDDSFDLAQGPDGGLVYVTDRNACVLHAIPFEETANFTGFDGDSADSFATFTGDETEAVTYTYMAPLTISVFPGIGFDLNSCVGAGCILISSGGVASVFLRGSFCSMRRACHTARGYQKHALSYAVAARRRVTMQLVNCAMTRCCYRWIQMKTVRKIHSPPQPRKCSHSM